MEIQQYSLPEINWLLSFPTEEVMRYWLNHEILDSPGLLMHIILGRILVFQMAKALPSGTEFDIDTALSLTTVYHATRQAADLGRLGKHTNPEVNKFMEGRLDMDYALDQAKKHAFSPWVIQWIQDYLINPDFRNQWYFPHETLAKDGKINWTEAIPMLTSWLIAGAMTQTSKRFQDLRDRRSEEIGVIELQYWKHKIENGEKIDLPAPIVKTALADISMNYVDEVSIIQWIKNGEVTDKKMGEWILNGFEEWTNNVLWEYARLAWIDDLYEFLEKWIDTIWESSPEKKKIIRNEFEQMLGRPLGQGEFIPYIDWFELLIKRIRWLKSEHTREVYRWKVSRSMKNIWKVVKTLSK